MLVLVLVMGTGGGSSHRSGVTPGDGWGRNFPPLILILFAVPVGLAVRVAVVHVLAVRTGVGESLQTLAALERLLAAVQPLVFRQVVLVFERLRTFDALVGTLA